MALNFNDLIMTSKMFAPLLVTIRAITHVIYMITISGYVWTLVQEFSKITNLQKMPQLIRGVRGKATDTTFVLPCSVQ
jgi:hypothetical protein